MFLRRGLGANVDVVGAVLGLFLVLLKPSWGPLGCSWGLLGLLLGALKLLLGALGAGQWVNRSTGRRDNGQRVIGIGLGGRFGGVARVR